MPQGRSLPKTQNVRLRLTTLGEAALVCESPEEPEQILVRPGLRIQGNYEHGLGMAMHRYRIRTPGAGAGGVREEGM